MPRRTFEQVQADEEAHDAVHSRVKALRNSWYFANVYQFICLFGDALKIDNEIDMDVFESECLKPEPSRTLAEIGLAILKWVSSHRGLTLEIFEEYTRRQYMAKSPDANPFGDEDQPVKFNDLDLFTKLRVLHQLSVWVFWNPDRMREKSDKLAETDQLRWRIEPFGFDSKERQYFVLDDNRLYRQTLVLPKSAKARQSKPKPKPKSKPSSTPRRASKRQKLANGHSSDAEEETDPQTMSELDAQPSEGFGDFKWECVAVTLEDYKDFLQLFAKSRDPDERELCHTITTDILPELEKAAGSRQRKEAQRLREMEAAQKMTNAKRSSRLAGKAEKEREAAERQAADDKRVQDLEMAQREQARQEKMEIDRESRMLTREQRIKDREVKRILLEEEQAKLERGESVDSDGVRVSERNRKAQVEQRQRDLDELRNELEDEKWTFDCSICGRQRNSSSDRWEDDQDAIACERCGIWQHSACHGIQPEEASRDDYHFICHGCQKPKKPFKLNVSSLSSKDAAAAQKPATQPSANDGDKPPKKKPGRPRKSTDNTLPGYHGQANGNSPQQAQWAPPSYQTQGSFRPTGQQLSQFQGGSGSSHMPPQHGLQESFNSPRPFPTQPQMQPSSAYQTHGAPVAPVSTHHMPAYNGASNGVAPKAPDPGAANPPASTQPHAWLSASSSYMSAQVPPLGTSAAATSAQATSTPNAKLQSSDGLEPAHTPASVSLGSFATPSHGQAVAAPESSASVRFLPSPHAGSNAAASGKSPVKHHPVTPASSFGAGPTAQDGTGRLASEVKMLQTPGGSGSGVIPPGPVLSPSVNAGVLNSQAPTKRPTPEKLTGELAVPPPPMQYPAPSEGASRQDGVDDTEAMELG